MNRCLNNFFAYCKGAPDFTGKGKAVERRNPFTKQMQLDHYHHHCTHDHKTCPDMVEQSQLAPTNEPGTIQLSLQSSPLGREAGK